MIRIAIRLGDPELADSYRHAVHRVRGAIAVSAGSGTGADIAVVDDRTTALAMVRQGHHVLLDEPFDEPVDAPAAKPAGPGPDEIDHACRAAGRWCVPACRWRFRPAIGAVCHALAAGELGEPCLFRAHRWEPRAVGAAELDAAGLTPEIDLACWFFESLPREVHALARDRCVQIHLGFEDGGMALVDLAVVPEGDAYRSLSLIGSRGATYADDHDDRQLLLAGGLARAVPPADDELDLVGLLGALTGAIATGRPPPVARGARADAAVVVRAARESAATARAVTVGGAGA